MPDLARAGGMLMSPEEFLAYPLSDEQAELVRGEVRVTPLAGAAHGRIGGNLFLLLSAHVHRQHAGFVFPEGTGYQLLDLPRTVRGPDVSFVRGDRLPKEGIGPGFLKLAPDLVVEVLSPSETASALEEKLDDYRACGTPLIWVIDPARLPGFSCAVAELFAGVAR